jgi:hypothetical protein
VAGNVSVASTAYSFTLDTAIPAAPSLALTTDTGSSASDKNTSNGALTVTGTESGATVEYSTNGGTSWSNSFTPATGSNSVQVRQTDVAGNVSTASTAYTFTLDTATPAAPSLALTTDTGSSASDKITSNGALTVTGTESGATVEYSTNGGTSWSNSFTPATGSNSVQVRQTDVAGNVSYPSQPFLFTLDTAIPAVTVSSDKTVLADGETASIIFNFSENPYGFSGSDLFVSGGVVSSLTQSVNPLVWSATLSSGTNLSSNQTSVQVTGNYSDIAGNAGAASNIVSVTNGAPTLTGLMFNSSVDVTTGAQAMNFTATASDSSGIGNVVVWLDKNLVTEIGSFSLVIVDPIFGNTWSDGTPGSAYQTRTVQTYTAPGAYNVTKVDVVDNAGNTHSYATSELQSMGIGTSFNVAGATGDSISPNIIGDGTTSNISGSDGYDILGGTNGRDLIDGKGGIDRLTGLLGGDIFVLGSGYGGSAVAQAATVTDFQNGIDQVGLLGSLRYSDLVISQGNGTDTDTGTTNTVIKVSSGEYLAVLLNMQATNVTQADFTQLNT